MSSVKVKICGLRRREDIEYVNQYKPDFVGFVFYEKSKRAVSAAQAQELKQLLDKQIKAVGVFVNAEQQLIARLVASKTIDLVQLHGDEDAAYCRSLRKLISVPLIKAVRVKGKSSLENLEEYQADYLLLDTYQAGVYGGTGQRFNVELDAKLPAPCFIAGGLDAENAAEIVQKTQPFAVDVSGGVETDGVKDSKKIAAFIASVRGERQ